MRETAAAIEERVDTALEHSLTARNRAEARGKATVKPIASPPRVASQVTPVAPRRAVRAS